MKNLYDYLETIDYSTYDNKDAINDIQELERMLNDTLYINCDITDRVHEHVYNTITEGGLKNKLAVAWCYQEEFLRHLVYSVYKKISDIQNYHSLDLGI